MAILSDSDKAAAAFSTALDNAKTATQNLFNSYGLTAYSPSTGGWTTTSAGAAFDPNNLITRNADTGLITANTAALQGLNAGQFGTGFGYNQISDVIRTSGSEVANRLAGFQARNIRGGLKAQGRAAGVGAQTRAQSNVLADFISKLGGVYGGVATETGNLMGSMIQTAGAGGQAVSDVAASTTGNAPSSAPAATGGKPTAPGTRMYALQNGYRWMGNKKGWVKV